MTQQQGGDDPYSRYIIKKYTYWTVYLNQDQRYLGRAYAWLLRHKPMTKLSELYPQEEFELFRIMGTYEHALAQIWKPDHMNYAWLGNLIKNHEGHGHLHLIPRYARPQIFAGTQFVDGRFEPGDEQNCWPNEKYIPSDETLIKICDAIREKM